MCEAYSMHEEVHAKGSLFGSLKKRKHSKDLRIGRRIIFKWIFKI
jgi:hypothetical protein